MEQKIETKKGAISTLILVLIVLVILVGVWYWWSRKTVPPQPTPPSTKEDSTLTINQELEGIDIGNLDKEFQEIDQDLNSL